MFDALEPEDQQPGRPTWEDLEAQINHYANYLCRNCNHGVKHYKHQFISDADGQVGKVLIAVSNRQMFNFISALIKCVQQFGQQDTDIIRLVGRLKERQRKYPY